MWLPLVATEHAAIVTTTTIWAVIVIVVFVVIVDFLRVWCITVMLLPVWLIQHAIAGAPTIIVIVMMMIVCLRVAIVMVMWIAVVGI